MKPMLARTVGPKFNAYPCFVQPKLNGVRALYQSGVFQSRDEKVWKHTVLQHLHDELALFAFDNSLILDGELYCHGMRLQDINGAIAVNRLTASNHADRISFHVFDIVNPNLKFSERWLDFYNSFPDLPHIRPVPTALVHSWSEAEQHFHLYTSQGYEGIMLRPDLPYEFGEHWGRNNNMTTFRSKSLWKHKSWEDDEYDCIGTTAGEGKAEIGVGALVLKTPSGATFKVGTGLTDTDRIEFAQTPPIGRKVRVRFLQLTADGIPFNPSFLAVL